jgi:hypothetical protein
LENNWQDSYLLLHYTNINTFNRILISFSTQVNDYGYRIPQDLAGKTRECHRILQESTGNNRNWKQYSHRNLSDFFPVDSGQFRELSSRNRSEIIGKNPKIFRWEYCFHVPAISSAFLPEPAHIFRPG